MNNMKIIKTMKKLSRPIKYCRDKNDEKNSIKLIDSSNDNNNQRSTLYRRTSCSCLVQFITLTALLLYLLIISTPVKNLQSFIPMKMRKTKTFLVVVAHPDDECLFFSPTILGLISHQKKGHLLVLSTGNSNGLGPIRENEVKQSCQRLNIDISRCLSLNLTDLQDNPYRWWPKRNISEIVQNYIEQFDIDLLITFDRGGISGHLNHKSIAIGIEYYINHVDKTPLTYEVTTVSLLFKFSSILDLLRTAIKFLPRLLRSFFSTICPFLFSPPNDQRILFVSSPYGYFKGLRAFHAHRSQMLWYRHLYTAFSRYMFINDLVKVSLN